MRKISKRNLILFNCIIALSFYNCGSDDDEDEFLGNWMQVSTFNEEPRSSATSFTIGTKGYMGTGYDGDDYFKDFWSYDMITNSWQQLADYPGKERSSATSFVINNEGYIGTGYNGDTDEELKDFYKYNTNSNTWTQIADFGGTARYGTVGFNSSTHGYVGSGFDGSNDKKDFWKYDPNSNTWVELFGFGGEKRRDGITFTINEEVYLLSGSNNGIYINDFWKFNTQTEVWTSLLDLTDEDFGDNNILRANAVGFSINNLGYIACGEIGAALASVWEYNPITREWEEKTQFERNARRDAIAFSNGDRAFVALGRNGTLYLDDAMEFFPLAEQDDDDN